MIFRKSLPDSTHENTRLASQLQRCRSVMNHTSAAFATLDYRAPAHDPDHPEGVRFDRAIKQVLPESMRHPAASGRAWALCLLWQYPVACCIAPPSGSE
jgi:hypothetical protein